MSADSPHTVVLGGGISGLTCAFRRVQQRQWVSLFTSTLWNGSVTLANRTQAALHS
jgi:anaerobic glycerol-3-phosphate dehydrogenase